MTEVTFEIVERIGNIGPVRDNGWAKSLNRISWNGGPIKWDIREFSPDMQRMSRGITLTDSEMQSIIELLANRF